MDRLLVAVMKIAFWLHNVAYHGASGTYHDCPFHGEDDCRE